MSRTKGIFHIIYPMIFYAITKLFNTILPDNTELASWGKPPVKRHVADSKEKHIKFIEKYNLPFSLRGKFTLVDMVNNTRNQTYLQLDRFRTRTIPYGSNSIKSKSI